MSKFATATFFFLANKIIAAKKVTICSGTSFSVARLGSGRRLREPQLHRTPPT